MPEQQRTQQQRPAQPQQQRQQAQRPQQAPPPQQEEEFTDQVTQEAQDDLQSDDFVPDEFNPDEMDLGGGDEFGGEDEIYDLSDTPERPTYQLLPAGLYNGIIDDVQFGESSKGNPMLTWSIEVEGPDERRPKLFYHTTLNEGGMPRVKRTITRLMQPGDQLNMARFNPRTDPEIFIGRECRVRVRIQTYQGERRNSVNDLLPPQQGGDQGFFNN